MNFLQKNFGGKQGLFLIIFAGVTFVLAGGAYAIILYVNGATRVVEQAEVESSEISPIYVDYYRDPSEYVAGESYIAMGNYAQDFPMPQNVQVLQGLTTHEVNGYMLNHIVGGMEVGCTYCHNINNFAADEWGDPVAEQNKWRARQHLLMVQDLNQNWLSMLPELTENKAPSGAQITCAVCHNGQAKFETYQANVSFVPEGFVLPLEPDVIYSVEEQGVLNVNGRNDISLDATQYNQVVMYHMNSAMNVGCTHCHNSRYFPSYEVPAKYYSMQMLQMTQYIHNEWGETLGGNVPSCWMCHQEAVIPPGSAQSVAVMPDPINSESELPLPEIYRMSPEAMMQMDAVENYADDMAPMDDMDMDEAEEDGTTEMGMNTN